MVFTISSNLIEKLAQRSRGWAHDSRHEYLFLVVVPERPLEEFKALFNTDMDGRNQTHKDNPLDMYDWANQVACNFRHGALEWWKENIAVIMEMIEWYEEIEGQHLAKDIHFVKVATQINEAVLSKHSLLPTPFSSPFSSH